MREDVKRLGTKTAGREISCVPRLLTCFRSSSEVAQLREFITLLERETAMLIIFRLKVPASIPPPDRIRLN